VSPTAVDDAARLNDRRFTTRSALTIAVVYAALGCLWILLSDQAVESLFSTPEAIIRASMLKGWLYVAATSLLLFFLVRHYLGKLQASLRREVENLRDRQRTYELLAAISEHSDDAIFAKDLDGRYLLFNPAASRFVGRPAGEVLGRDERALFPAAQAAMVRAVDERVIATGCIETNEEVLDLPHGRRTFLSTRGPLRDAGQRIIGIFGISRDITASQQARDALLQSAVRLRLLVEHSPVALAMFDRDMCYVAASDRWSKEFGLGGQSLIGRSHYEVFPEIGEEAKELHRRGLAGEALGSEADRFDRADGSVQWLRWQLRPWLLPEGAIGGIVIFAEDISQRMATEIALGESERRFHDIVEASADWIWEVDGEARYTYASAGVESLLGYSAAEVIGRTPFDFMPPVEAERVRSLFRDIAARRAPFRDLDNVHLHRDGSLRHVSTNGMPILAADGTLRGYRGLDRDVSARKAAELALQRLADDLGATLRAIPDLLFELDADGRYCKVMATQEALLAAPADQLLGRKLTDVLPPEAAATGLAALAAASRCGTDYGRTITLPVAEGSRHFEISVACKPMVAGQTQRFIVLSRDITRRKVAEDELRQRNAELERFNRATIGRELDMLEMKQTINALSRELGREAPYPLVFLEDQAGATTGRR
jgi:PAS domain S-box-containing protein